MLIRSENMPSAKKDKDMLGDAANKQQPPLMGQVKMPNYVPAQLDHLLNVQFDMSYLNTDQSFLAKAFKIDPVQFQFENIKK